MVRLTLLNKEMADVPVPLGDALELTFDDIANVPVADASSVSDWNTFFDLPTYGSPFTSVDVVGNMVKLIGGSGIKFKDYLFFEFTHITKIDDLALCISETGFNSISSCDRLAYFKSDSITTLGDGTFSADTSLLYVSAINATYIGDGCFSICSILEEVIIPSCTSLGSTTGDDWTFYIEQNTTITITIPAALMTCNGGNPDGDIQYLQANNTVTVITV